MSTRYGKAHHYWAEYFENQVQRDRGYESSVFAKAKDIDKFGRSEAAGTSISTVWSQGGNETYLTGNTITKLTSSVASTTTITVEGHTIASDGFTFVVQQVTLNGTADVALPIPLARCSRLANIGSVVLTGTVSARTAANVIYAQIPAGEQQTFKAATTISKDDVFGIDYFRCGVTEKTAASVQFQIEVREFGGVFRPKDLFVAASPGPSTIVPYEPWLVVPPNADIRVRCVASANSTGVAASFSGVLARIL